MDLCRTIKPVGEPLGIISETKQTKDEFKRVNKYKPSRVPSYSSSSGLSAVFAVTSDLATTDRGREGDSADIKTPEWTEISPSRAAGARLSSAQTDETRRRRRRRRKKCLDGSRHFLLEDEEEGEVGGRGGIRFRHDVRRQAADFIDCSTRREDRAAAKYRRRTEQDELSVCVCVQEREAAFPAL